MSVQFNTAEFKQTAAKVSAATGRTMAEQLNRMGYFIARGACRNTVKVSRETIIKELTEDIEGAPRAALLIQAARGKAGQPGLKGAAMAKTIRQFIAARIRSRAFLASGWLPAIKYLAGLVSDKRGQPGIGSGVKQFGAPKGGATSARGQQLVAKIWNSTGAQSASASQALEEKGEPALALAFNDEVRKSKAYWERKLAEAWRGAGAKAHH